MEETQFWKEARIIIHLIGVSGVGKTTLCNRLARRIEEHGARVITTLDYDPAIPDTERSEDRAFSRELDRLSNESVRLRDEVLPQPMEHALSLLDQWDRSNVNVVIVDRWYESYDYQPPYVHYTLEQAQRDSSFLTYRVFLEVDQQAVTEYEAMKNILDQATKKRPDGWWKSNAVDTFDNFVDCELWYQKHYRNFVYGSELPHLVLKMTATDMMLNPDDYWQARERQVVESIMSEFDI